MVAAAGSARERGVPLKVVADEHGNPTWAPDLAHAVAQAVSADLRGVLHLAGEPPATRYECAREILASVAGLELVAISRTNYQRPAPVPPRAILNMERASSLGFETMDWRPPTRRYAAQLLAGATP